MTIAIDIPYPKIDGTTIKLPHVAVVIGNYNQAEFVADAIRSVAGQTYRLFECVIVDDCSTDNSVSVIEEILTTLGDSRFRLHAKSRNEGQMVTMYSGMDLTSAPFVAWLDADDLWLPTFLERHIASHLNPHINAALSSSNSATIARDGTLLAGANPSFSVSHPGRPRKRAESIEIPQLRDGAALASEDLFVRNNFESWIWSPTSGIMFRRSVAEAIRPLNPEDIRICADLYLARFGHFIGGSILINDVLGYYRIHGGNGYSKYGVYGDNTLTGQHPAGLEALVTESIVRRICEGEDLFVKILPEVHLANIMAFLARKELRSIQAVMNSRLLSEHIPIKTRRKFRRKLARNRLRGLLGFSRKS